MNASTSKGEIGNGQPARRRRGLVARFRRDRRGSVAVEFAMISIPFIGLVYAIFETSMVHISGQILQTAVTDASRMLMTGQAQTANFDEAKFKTEVCNRVKAMFDCKALLKIDVRTAANFGSADTSKPPVNAGNMDTTGFQYAPGGPRTINVVRGVIAYPIILPLIGQTFVNLNGNKLLMMGTAVFQTEPYATGSS